MNLFVSVLMLAFILAPLAQSSDAPAATAVDEDFRARCTADGVVLCVGFDSAGDFSGEFVNPAADGLVHATMDESVRASGAGSLRFEIPSNSYANSSGYWVSSLGRRFGPGSTLFMQFRQRFSSEFLDIRYQPEAGWKQFILYTPGPSCTSVQLVSINWYLRGLPTMYSACGADGLYVELRDGDHLIQQGDYRCHRRSQGRKDCAWYVPDEWMTFSYRVDVGEYGTATTRVQAWIGNGSGPLRQFIDFPDLTLEYDDSPDEGFGVIQLTPYHTGKEASQAHPVAHTWYDELIISSAPIAAPAVNR